MLKQNCKQKQAIRIVSNVDCFSHTQTLFNELNILNVYKLNLYQVLIFMFKLDKNILPILFYSIFEKTNHMYPTRFSKYNYIQSKTYYSATKFSIVNRGPKLWNIILNNEMKTNYSLNQFKKKLKQLLLLTENELNFF